DGIAEQHRRPGRSDHAGRTEKQAGADGAAQRNQLDMAVLQAALQWTGMQRIGRHGRPCRRWRWVLPGWQVSPIGKSAIVRTGAAGVSTCEAFLHARAAALPLTKQRAPAAAIGAWRGSGDAARAP